MFTFAYILLGDACEVRNPFPYLSLEDNYTINYKKGGANLFAYPSFLISISYTPSNKRIGSSSSSFTRTRKLTDSRPSMMR